MNRRPAASLQLLTNQWARDSGVFLDADFSVRRNNKTLLMLIACRFLLMKFVVVGWRGKKLSRPLPLCLPCLLPLPLLLTRLEGPLPIREWATQKGRRLLLLNAACSLNQRVRVLLPGLRLRDGN